MPAYNAERTIEQTWREVVEQQVVDLVVVVDDGSRDRTAAVARSSARSSSTPIRTISATARTRRPVIASRFEHGADIVVMVHPDYQYTPKLIPAMVDLVAERSVRVRARLADPRRTGVEGRDAGLAVRRQPRPHAGRATCCSAPRSRSFTPAIARSPASCWNGCRSTPTRTTSSSTTRCSPRRSGSGTRLARCRVRHGMPRMHRRSRSAGACATGSAAWRPQSPSDSAV